MVDLMEKKKVTLLDAEFNWSWNTSGGKTALSLAGWPTMPDECEVYWPDNDLAGGIICWQSQKFSSQRLFCNTDQTDWCDHIQALVNQQADPPFILNADTDWYFSAPWMPTLGQWIDCVVYAEKIGGGKKVEMKVVATERLEHLGYLQKHEGIKTIRLLVQEWLENFRYEEIARNEPVLQCTSETHDYQAQTQIDKAKSKAGRNYWAQAWAIHGLGKCLRCLSYNDQTPDVPDL